MRLGLIGYPLGHSISPQIQNAALKAMRLPGEYQLFPVPPLPHGAAGLEELVKRLRLGELDGLNVTIPHKQSILPLLDDLTLTARQAGAANTLFRHGKKILGDTTDVPGLLADLRAWLLPACVKPQRALILGAGGSARAAALALLEDNWQVWVAARREEQAAELAQTINTVNGSAIESLPLRSGALERLEGISLVVNCTPLGMSPQVEECPWPDMLPLPAGAAVYDLIYNPAETVLLQRARRQGLPARNGLGMLVEQGALSLERWTGRHVPREIMWKAIK